MEGQHRRFGRHQHQLLIALILSSFLSGCSTLSYLMQAGRGQMRIMNRARPISEVIQDERTPPKVRNLLSEVAAIKSYGETRGLKPTSNYQDYVLLDHAYASYVVSACHPLKFEPKTWSFPFVGSFSYLGWFHPEDAKKHAEKIRTETGWDVDVRGATAFSTLGWFKDPILSSMLDSGDEALGELVNVVLHESVHATIYVSDQSSFNESLASFIADRLTVEYLKASRGSHDKELQAYEKAVSLSDARRKQMHGAYEALNKVYESAMSDEEKLAEKAKVLAALTETLKAKRAINNATLIQYKTYDTGSPVLEKAFNRCSQSMKNFIAAFSKLKPSDFPSRQMQQFDPVIESLLLRASEYCPSESTDRR